MCLEKITKVYKPSLFNLWIPKFAYKSGIGWKVFSETEGQYVFSWVIESDDIGKIKIPMGIFIDEEHYRQKWVRNKKLGYENNWYSYGWHIFRERLSEDWKKDVWKRVEYKYGHTEGISFRKPTIIAKWMKILEN